MLQLQRVDGRKLYLGVGIVLFMLVLGMSSLGVQGASSISQGFKTTDSRVVPGAIVSLKSGTANTVELSSSANIDRLLGVVGNKSLIELSNNTGKVEVVTTGQAAVLVSNINGDVKTGDKITASPIAGVGMKALTSTLVIGTAQANLSSVATETRRVTDKEGHKQSVKMGSLPVQVDKVFYQAEQDRNSYVPPALQNFANNLVGKKVTPLRIVVAAFVVFFVFVTVVVLVFSSVRSSIISIGRNPLSESAVQKSLIEVGLTSFGVMAFAAIVVYIILTT